MGAVLEKLGLEGEEVFDHFLGEAAEQGVDELDNSPQASNFFRKFRAPTQAPIPFPPSTLLEPVPEYAPDWWNENEKIHITSSVVTSPTEDLDLIAYLNVASNSIVDDDVDNWSNNVPTVHPTAEETRLPPMLRPSGKMRSDEDYWVVWLAILVLFFLRQRYRCYRERRHYYRHRTAEYGRVASVHRTSGGVDLTLEELL